MRTPSWFWLLAPLPGLALAGLLSLVDHSQWTDDYDQYFRKYTKHYFGPHMDWRWFKSQGIAESGLDPSVSSHAGAVGIMQVLPSTYEEIKEKNPHLKHIEEPRWNIAAGIYYDRMLYRKWKEGLPTQERLSFALASYNAGYGNISKAFRQSQRKHQEVKSWNQVAPFAPKETKSYVNRIKELMQLN